MCKIPVVAGSYPEHPEKIKERADDPIEPGCAGEECRKWQQMHQDEADFSLQHGPIALLEYYW